MRLEPRRGRAGGEAGEACSTAYPAAASWRAAPSRAGPASATTSTFRRPGDASLSSTGSGMPWRTMNEASSSGAIRRWPPGVRCALRRRAVIQLTTVGSDTPSSRAASKVV